MKNNVIVILAIVALALSACGKKEGGRAAKKGNQASASASASDKAAPKKSKGSKYSGSDSVKDAGKISGTVSYAGAEKDGTSKVTKDNTACGQDRAEGALVVTGGKLKNAVVYLEGVTSGKNWASDSVTVDNVGCVFTPRVSIGKHKGKLVAKNSDPVLHNTHLFLKKGNKNLFNIALPQKDQTIEKPLRKKGLVDVKCDAHEWMQGWVFVSDHPYAAVTDENGAYSLDNVPAGEYVIKVWHEKLGEKEAPVKVTAAGSATSDFAF